MNSSLEGNPISHEKADGFMNVWINSLSHSRLVVARNWSIQTYVLVDLVAGVIFCEQLINYLLCQWPAFCVRV